MELPTNSIRQYILESCKNITAYATSTVTLPMKLFCLYFTEGWNKITPNGTANHRWNNSVGIFQWVMFFLACIVCLQNHWVFLLTDMLTENKLLTSGFWMDDFRP
jgi:hypothetical protein